jgi:hypothetical protein
MSKLVVALGCAALVSVALAVSSASAEKPSAAAGASTVAMYGDAPRHEQPHHRHGVRAVSWQRMIP